MPNKTTPLQLLCALFVSRLLVSFTYVSVPGGRVDGGAAALGVVFAGGVLALCLLPMKRYLNTENGGLLIRARRISPALCRVCAALYAAGFLFAAFSAALRIELFTGTVLFRDNRNHWLTALLLLGAAYGAYKGLPAVSRSAVVVAALTAAGMVVLLCVLAGRLRWEYLVFPFAEGVFPLLRQTVSSIGGTAELAILPALAGRLSCRFRKRDLLFLPVCFLAAAILALLDRLILGAYGETELFPVYALSSQAEVGDVRLDALFTAIWILCAMIKVSLYLCAVLAVLEDGFGVRDKRIPLAVSCAVIAGAAVACSFRVGSAAVFSSPLPPLLSLTLTLLVPLAVTAGERIHSRRTVLRKGGAV